MQARCSGATKAGRRCNSFAQPGSAFCVTHDPDRVTDLARWRRAGGSARSNRSRARKALPPAMTPAELQSVMGATLKAVLNKSVEPAIGNCVANLGRAIVAVREATDLERRLEELEQAAAEQAPGRRWGA